VMRRIRNDPVTLRSDARRAGANSAPSLLAVLVPDEIPFALRFLADWSALTTLGVVGIKRGGVVTIPGALSSNVRFFRGEPAC
jgi:hypothetical protein